MVRRRRRCRLTMFRAKALENSNKLPRVLVVGNDRRGSHAGRRCNPLAEVKLEALESGSRRAAAATGRSGCDDSLINSKIAKLQAGMSALMQMMKQRQEMESNMSKMFSEMAMSAIRNMR
jgi:hypothetical protein